MEKSFHIFTRRHAEAGFSATVLGHPQLCSFSSTLALAREDLSSTLERLLREDKLGLASSRLHWPGIRTKRVDMAIRALQHQRMIEVPMRFTVLHHPALSEMEDDDDGDHRSGILVRIPRLDVSSPLAEAADLVAFSEETIRHRLHMVKLERLLQVAFTGDEAVEELKVEYRPRVVKERKEKPTKAGRAQPRPETLAQACRCLNDEVEADTLERAYHLDGVVTPLTDAIVSTRSSILLVGPHGAGKSALVHELVHRAHGDPKAPLAGTLFYSTSGARIIAGMAFLGQWQARAVAMVEELRRLRAVLHVESLSELLATSPGSGLSLAQFFQQPVESGAITLILEATEEDAARAERTHPSLMQALRRVAVPTLDRATTRMALSDVAARLGRRRKARLDGAALEMALDLGDRFGDSALPMGLAVQLVRSTLSALPSSASDVTVAADKVLEAFCQRTGYPRALVDPAVPLDPDDVVRQLQSRVVGQPHAMALLADMVITLKTGLSDPTRPLGSFLLLGPTGVGKTESALALTQHLFHDEKRLARFDMSEYAAPGDGARLVGGPGGEGALTRRVREQPFGVVLLDEIEKADPSVFDLLLQVLGEGRLSDAAGGTVSFRNTVVVLTSNLGADRVGHTMGFQSGGSDAVATHYRSAVASFFRPELINRLDHVVPFQALAPTHVAEIARKLLDSALQREGLVRRGVQVTFDDGVPARLAVLGHDPRYGARPLKRALEQHVMAPLSALLAAHTSPAPRHLHVRVAGAALDVVVLS